MKQSWHKIWLSLAAFWRAMSLICFAGALIGALFVNLPGRPVIAADIFWMLATGAILLVIHLILLSVAQTSEQP